MKQFVAGDGAGRNGAAVFPNIETFAAAAVGAEVLLNMKPFVAAAVGETEVSAGISKPTGGCASLP